MTRNSNSFNLFSRTFFQASLFVVLGMMYQPTVIAGPNLPDLVERILPSVVNISSISVSQPSIQGWDEFLRFWGVPKERKNTSLTAEGHG